MTTGPTTRKIPKARDIPPSWQVELPDDPEAAVEVSITPLPPSVGESSPLRILDAGKGLFASAAEADAYVRRNRDTW